MADIHVCYHSELFFLPFRNIFLQFGIVSYPLEHCYRCDVSNFSLCCFQLIPVLKCCKTLQFVCIITCQNIYARTSVESTP